MYPHPKIIRPNPSNASENINVTFSSFIFTGSDDWAEKGYVFGNLMRSSCPYNLYWRVF